MIESSVLLIYTGGTIGMMQDAKTGALCPFDFKQITEQVPELQRFKFRIDSISFEQPIDSSNMHPGDWIRLAEIIEENYERYNGFVILHGSDTMAYTASALSFMLQGLTKPVILTGSQLPIGVIRTDGKENLITAIEIAAAQQNGVSVIQEVAVYFEYTLLRGNRTTKYNSEHFDAFVSPNYPALAEAGITIRYNTPFLHQESSVTELKVYKKMDNDIANLKLFPGFSRKITESILFNPAVKAIVLETFGSGNAPTDEWFLSALQKAADAGKIILNITQCSEGRVMQGKYQTSTGLSRIGVIGGQDLTFEAACTKLMYLLGNYSKEECIRLLGENLCGEMTIND